MKRLIVLAVLALVGCTHSTQVQIAQASHDALALAQDTEARLCWDVPNVQAAMAANVPPTHCTSQVAPLVGLTDERHQRVNGLFKQAFDEHARLTRIVATGIPADFSAYQALIAQIKAIVAALTPTSSDVNALVVQVNKAGVQ